MTQIPLFCDTIQNNFLSQIEIQTSQGLYFFDKFQILLKWKNHNGQIYQD